MSSPRRARALFIGPNGWRAGWRFLLFFTIVFLCAKALDGLISRVGGYQERPGEWSAAGLLIDAAPRYRRSPCPAVPLEHAYGRSLARLKPVGGHRLPGEETRHERDLGAVT